MSRDEAMNERANWMCCYCGGPVFTKGRTVANAWTEADPARPPDGLRQWMAHPRCMTTARPQAMHPLATPRLITKAPPGQAAQDPFRNVSTA